MVLKTLLCLMLSLTVVPSVLAQSTFHVFPQVADGFAAPWIYKSAFMVRNASTSASVDCTLRLYGLRATMLALRRGTVGVPDSVFPVMLGGDNWAYFATTGQQALATGYATLTCTGPVFAQMLYSLYSGSAKVGEATVFSSDENPRAQFIADQTEGSRLGVAIANNTDVLHDYQITVLDVDAAMLGTATVRIGPRSSLARFLDELLPASANTVGSAIIRAMDSSAFSTIGLRVTGAVFATIPATR